MPRWSGAPSPGISRPDACTGHPPPPPEGVASRVRRATLKLLGHRCFIGSGVGCAVLYWQQGFTGPTYTLLSIHDSSLSRGNILNKKQRRGRLQREKFLHARSFQSQEYVASCIITRLFWETAFHTCTSSHSLDSDPYLLKKNWGGRYIASWLPVPSEDWGNQTMAMIRPHKKKLISKALSAMSTKFIKRRLFTCWFFISLLEFFFSLEKKHPEKRSPKLLSSGYT